MPQKVIKFKGINRDINEYYTSGECEELINLRPKANGGLSVVKPKKEIYNLIAYEQYYEHTFSDNRNQIAVLNGDVMWVNSPKGKVSVTKEFVGKKIAISFAGNVMIVYCNEDLTQSVFKFEDGAYEKYIVNLRPITDISIESDWSTSEARKAIFLVLMDGTSATVAEVNAALANAESGFYAKYQNGLCGVVTFGCTYELEDGSEIWSTAFVTADISREENYYGPGHYNSYSAHNVRIEGASQIKLKLSFGGDKSVNVRKVNIYSTMPSIPYEFTKVDYYNGVDDLSTTYADRKKTIKDESAGELMYYQGSIDPNEDTVTFVPKFGKELAGEKVMEVLPGCIERVGEIVSYNNRFHYYNSGVYHTLQLPTTSVWSEETDADIWIAYVNIDGKWYLIDKVYQINTAKVNDFIYPMAGINKLAFVKATENADGTVSSQYNEMFYINLKDSSAYNFSYAYDVMPEVTIVSYEFYNSISLSGQVLSDSMEYTKKVFYKNETNVINVSAQYNPFSFPVEYSYAFSGDIIDIATSYLPVSSVQIGQYPLTVFTTNGIHALEQGNGSVLYSNIVPLQPLVSRGKSVSTPHGTFFFSSDNMYLLSGRELANVSGIMQGKAESNIRELEAYQKLCFSKEAQIYDFSSLISSIEFKDFIANASLTYDPLQDEVIISNQDENVIPYSYVLNLSGKTYHKIMLRYTQFQNGGRYVLTDSGTQRSVVDLHSENDYAQYILLQSRPMSLDVLYTHMQRLMLLADTNLTGRQYLFVSVFASDNLHDWKCIISAQKRNTVFKHIRTNKAAKSYKDYVILINGCVSTDTDISDLIADYTVVQRRLG
jgi:hypothetical protein